MVEYHCGPRCSTTDVFLHILAVLQYMASLGSTDEVADYRSFLDGILGHKVRPSFLNYQCVILSVGKIAGYMMQLRRFVEVDIEIAV